MRIRKRAEINEKKLKRKRILINLVKNLNKFLYNSDEKELDSFLDTLLWKYNIEDHQFLMDKKIFER